MYLVLIFTLYMLYSTNLYTPYAMLLNEWGQLIAILQGVYYCAMLGVN